MLAALLALLLLPATAHAADATATFLDRIEAMQQAAAKLHDATFHLHKREWVGSEMTPRETLAVKFQRPLALYMRWVGEVNQGREVLFRSGWNDGRLRVDPGGLVPTLNLDPHGRLAMRNSRHAIHSTSPLHTVEMIVGDVQRLQANPDHEAKVEDRGEHRIHGESARCLVSHLPKDRDPAYYARRVEVCFANRTDLPIRVRAWDHEGGEVRLVEEYVFEDLQVNVGLSSADFDPDHPEYGF